MADPNIDALLERYLLLLDQYTTLRDEANKLQSSVRNRFVLVSQPELLLPVELRYTPSTTAKANPPFLLPPPDPPRHRQSKLPQRPRPHPALQPGRLRRAHARLYLLINHIPIPGTLAHTTRPAAAAHRPLPNILPLMPFVDLDDDDYHDHHTTPLAPTPVRHPHPPRPACRSRHCRSPPATAALPPREPG
jgi:hypothetical protein